MLFSFNICVIERNDFIGSVENVQDCETREINPAYLQAIAEQRKASRPRAVLSAKKKQFIIDNVKLQVPEQFQKQYLNVLLKNHEAISQDKFDLGRTDTLMHESMLTSFTLSDYLTVIDLWDIG